MSFLGLLLPRSPHKDPTLAVIVGLLPTMFLPGNQLIVYWAPAVPYLRPLILEGVGWKLVAPTQQGLGALTPYRRMPTVAGMAHLAYCRPACEEKDSETREVLCPESHPSEKGLFPVPAAMIKIYTMWYRVSSSLG